MYLLYSPTQPPLTFHPRQQPTSIRAFALSTLPTTNPTKAPVYALSSLNNCENVFAEYIPLYGAVAAFETIPDFAALALILVSSMSLCCPNCVIGGCGEKLPEAEPVPTPTPLPSRGLSMAPPGGVNFPLQLQPVPFRINLLRNNLLPPSRW